MQGIEGAQRHRERVAGPSQDRAAAAPPGPRPRAIRSRPRGAWPPRRSSARPAGAAGRASAAPRPRAARSRRRPHRTGGPRVAPGSRRDQPQERRGVEVGDHLEARSAEQDGQAVGRGRRRLRQPEFPGLANRAPHLERSVQRVGDDLRHRSVSIEDRQRTTAPDAAQMTAQVGLQVRDAHAVHDLMMVMSSHIVKRSLRRFANRQDLVGRDVLEDLERAARPADLDAVDARGRARGRSAAGRRSRRRSRQAVVAWFHCWRQRGSDACCQLHDRADPVAVALGADEPQLQPVAGRRTRSATARPAPRARSPPRRSRPSPSRSPNAAPRCAWRGAAARPEASERSSKRPSPRLRKTLFVSR